jgi:Ca-activated chloride channel family protein
VVVLDTSNSMKGEKLKQAKGALKAALDSLRDDDRFSLIQFATVVTPFRDGLLKATPANLAEARAWVEKLEAQGATDIGSALDEALKLSRSDDRRSSRLPDLGPVEFMPPGVRCPPPDFDQPGRDDGRTFQVVFFTDGLPTAGSTAKQILDDARPRVSGGGGIRVFTFGVGDDVDAHLLDQLAETSRAASTYVRPSENLEAKASTLVAKISHPVRTDLNLRVGGGVRLLEMYPPRLPDLFRGEQLQVAGRYEGSGHVALTLESRVGSQRLADTYEISFPEVATNHDFIAPIWGRRKVGYLLDQIRLHGESIEAKDEIIRLAREFGIATPYTSLLVVPDDRPYGLVPPHRSRLGAAMGRGGELGEREETELRVRTEGLAREPGKPALNAPLSTGAAGGQPSQRSDTRGKEAPVGRPAAPVAGATGPTSADSLSATRGAGLEGRTDQFASDFAASVPSSGKEAIDLAQQLVDLKSNKQLDTLPLVKNVSGHRFRKVGDVWVDDLYERSAPTFTLKVFSAAYFRLLSTHPEMKPIFALGDRVVWIAPNGHALVIDTAGDEEASDDRLNTLFKPTTK